MKEKKNSSLHSDVTIENMIESSKMKNKLIKQICKIYVINSITSVEFFTNIYLDSLPMC
jgi:Mg/Co/Ni transporter MgtE